MTTLWLVRHGETDWNVERRFQGKTDTALNKNGEAQARCLAPRLAEMPFDAAYSSDLRRVTRTADLALSESNGLTLQTDVRLRELDFGTWEGLTWDDIREQHPEDFALWVDDREQNPHGGERISEVVARVRVFIDELRAEHGKGEQVLIFAHGGTLAVLICLLLGNDPKLWWQYRFMNCSLSEIMLVSRGAVLSRLNDTSHLETLKT